MSASTIHTSPEVERFNRAVEWADRLTGYKYDRVDAPDLVRVLRSSFSPEQHACAMELTWILEAATRNPNAGVVQAFPTGRWQ